MFGKIRKFIASCSASFSDWRNSIELPSGQSGPTNEQEDKEFMGIHFEGLGNVWEAIFGDSSEGITECVPWVLNEGVLEKECHSSSRKDRNRVALIQAPAKGDVRAAVLLVQTENSENMEVWSGYPVLKGLSNMLVVNKTHTWSNGVEGVVAAHAAQDGPPVTFFDPFYFRDFPKFVPGETISVSLGALAFSIAQAQANPFTISEGPLYEMRLAEFLKDNPEKGRKDFLPLEVSYAGSRILFPSTYACEWTFRCPVKAVQQTVLLNTRFAKITTDFVGLDDELLRGYLYASEHVLKGYCPQPGDDVEGVLWMTGYIT